MRLISHRGNINGPNSDRENSPDYILETLSLGYDVEIDVWFENNRYVLGHDKPQYEISADFLNNNGLWIHCKTNLTLSKIVMNPKCNCFFHNSDDVVLTSKKYLWTYPGKLLYNNSICVLPELFSNCSISNIAGACSDFIGRYKHD